MPVQYTSSMLKYGNNQYFDPSQVDPLNIDRQSTAHVPENSRVLDVGCATGALGYYLICAKHCTVVGINTSKEESTKARKHLTQAIYGDATNTTLIHSLGKFDVIFASSLIEHLVDPQQALCLWKTALKKHGLLIITTPNIAHWSMRLHLLLGKFEYQQYGILDNTHLHFYTPKTFQELVKKAGYTIENFSIDSVGGGYPKLSKFLARFFPNVFAYQMVIRARK